MTSSNTAAISSSRTTIATAVEPAANAMGPNGRLLVVSAEERVIETLGSGLRKAGVAVELLVVVLTAGVGSGVLSVHNYMF